MQAVFGHCTLDQRRQVDTTADALIEMEVQLRHAAQLHRAAQVQAQEAGGAVQGLERLLHCIWRFFAHDGDEDLGMA
ncbi:hypothetical protein D3C81_1949680 [compost metagenome]